MHELDFVTSPKIGAKSSLSTTKYREKYFLNFAKLDYELRVPHANLLWRNGNIFRLSEQVEDSSHDLKI